VLSARRVVGHAGDLGTPRPRLPTVLTWRSVHLRASLILLVVLAIPAFFLAILIARL